MKSFFIVRRNRKASLPGRFLQLLLLLLCCHSATYATVYTVNSTSDANSGSGTSGTLRYCITQANAVAATPASPHLINFAITPLDGTVKTIGLNTLLPSISQPMIINGYTQNGSLPTNGIGSIANRYLTIQVIANDPYNCNFMFTINATGTVICGLNIITTLSSTTLGTIGINHNVTNSSDPYTLRNTDNVWIWGCNFGTTPDGMSTYPSGGTLQTTQGSQPISVGGNTGGPGTGTSRPVGVSNLNGWIIGVKPGSTNPGNEGNIFSEIDPSSSATYEPARFTNCDNFIIAGNYFGLKKDGVHALQPFNPNGYYYKYGISIANSINFRVGTDGDGVNDVLERNYFVGIRGAGVGISGNALAGTNYSTDANYSGRNAANHVIAGNYFGTNTIGTTNDPDLQNIIGVLVFMTHDITIGGNTPTLANVIVNSTSYGINVKGDKFSGNILPAKNNIITGNYIGVLADGVTAAPNNIGIALNADIQRFTNALTPADTAVYKTSISKNVIAYNTGGGIQVRPKSANGRTFDNTFTQNTIYGNTGLGINLGSSDADVSVTGNNGLWPAIPTSNNTNRLMNYGVVQSASLSGNNLTIKGFVGKSVAGNTAFAGATIEFFVADNNPADQNGERFFGDGKSLAHGEGRTYLGSLIADGNGKFTGTLDVTGKGVVAGTLITNTATSTTGSTSEFGVDITPITVAGNVYDDANGLNDNKVNGSGTNAGGINAVLYDSSLQVVVGVMPVTAGGTFNFPNAISGSNYTVYVTTNPVSVDQTTTPTVALPAGWVATGEVNCGKIAGCTGGDGSTPDAILNLGTLGDSVLQANFGLDQVPVTTAYSTTLSSPPAINTILTLNDPAPGVGKTPPPPGTDPEDGTLVADTNITIKSIPPNATLIYNGTNITTANYVIHNYNPALLQIKLTAPGSVTTSFTFAFNDKAGVSSNTSTYTINWPVALPLHLLSFTGQRKDNINVLSWITSMEENTSSFDIERSADGNTFAAIGNVAATGNSTTTHQYTYTDMSAGADAFYRLRMIDMDGGFTYSSVVRLSANNTGTGDMTVGNVYPVPFSEVLHITIASSKDQQAIVQLYDMNGSLVAQYNQPLTKGINTCQLGNGQFTSLASGMYILSVKTDSGVVTKQVTKQ